MSELGLKKRMFPSLHWFKASTKVRVSYWNHPPNPKLIVVGLMIADKCLVSWIIEPARQRWWESKLKWSNGEGFHFNFGSSKYTVCSKKRSFWAHEPRSMTLVDNLMRFSREGEESNLSVVSTWNPFLCLLGRVLKAAWVPNETKVLIGT